LVVHGFAEKGGNCENGSNLAPFARTAKIGKIFAASVNDP
jgi:hypothetical protein